MFGAFCIMIFWKKGICPGLYFKYCNNAQEQGTKPKREEQGSIPLSWLEALLCIGNGLEGGDIRVCGFHLYVGLASMESLGWQVEDPLKVLH